MRRYRRNADEPLRRLEREAKTGDPLAMSAYRRELWRLFSNGDLDSGLALLDIGATYYEEVVGVGVVSRGKICGWDLAWEHPGFISLYKPGLIDHLGFMTTPWHDTRDELGTHSPFSIVWGDGGQQVHLEDLETPRTGDAEDDVEAYRAAIRERLGMLAGAFAARAAGICDCGDEWGRARTTCPTHGIPFSV